MLPAFLPGLLWGQQASAGGTLTYIVSSGEGIARQCYQREYGLGLGARASAPVLTPWAMVQVSGRGHWLNRGSTCATLGDIPRADGTYIEDDRVNLLSRSFITTDVRLAAQLGESAQLAAGVGNAWRESHDVPYLLLAGELILRERPKARLALIAEYQVLRVTSDQFRRTYQDFQLISEEPLGQAHEWSDAFVLGIALDFPF